MGLDPILLAGGGEDAGCVLVPVQSFSVKVIQLLYLTVFFFILFLFNLLLCSESACCYFFLYSLPAMTAILNSARQDIKITVVCWNSLRGLNRKLFNPVQWLSIPKKCLLPGHHLLMSCYPSPGAHPFTLCLHFFLPVNVVSPVTCQGWGRGDRELSICASSQ